MDSKRTSAAAGKRSRTRAERAAARSRLSPAVRAAVLGRYESEENLLVRPGQVAPQRNHGVQDERPGERPVTHALTSSVDDAAPEEGHIGTQRPSSGHQATRTESKEEEPEVESKEPDGQSLSLRAHTARATDKDSNQSTTRVIPGNATNIEERVKKERREKHDRTATPLPRERPPRERE